MSKIDLMIGPTMRAPEARRASKALALFAATQPDAEIRIAQTDEAIVVGVVGGTEEQCHAIPNRYEAPDA